MWDFNVTIKNDVDLKNAAEKSKVIFNVSRI